MGFGGLVEVVVEVVGFSMCGYRLCFSWVRSRFCFCFMFDLTSIYVFRPQCCISYAQFPSDAHKGQHQADGCERVDAGGSGLQAWYLSPSTRPLDPKP